MQCWSESCYFTRVWSEQEDLDMIFLQINTLILSINNLWSTDCRTDVLNNRNKDTGNSLYFAAHSYPIFQPMQIYVTIIIPVTNFERIVSR